MKFTWTRPGEDPAMSQPAESRWLLGQAPGELGPRGIRVNAVAPGWVVTDMTREVLPEGRLPEPIPLGRVGVPADVAGPAVFLASSMADFITGTILDVNGGAYLR